MAAVTAGQLFLNRALQQPLRLHVPEQIITRTASTRVAEYAFKYAQDNNRQSVTAVHKVLDTFSVL